MRAQNHLHSLTLLNLALIETIEMPDTARSHLRDCARCTADLADFRTLAEILRDPSAEPSEVTLARVHALAYAKAPSRREARWFTPARLIHDSGAVAALGGIRAPVETRQQVWWTPEADLDLRLEAGGVGSPAEFIGQVLPRGERSLPPVEGKVWLFEPGRFPASSTVAVSGEFSLPAPRRSRWSIWLAWGSLRLRLASRL